MLDTQDPCGAVLIALADPTRRRIFEVLVHKPRSVAAVAQTVPVSRPAVSQHLRQLSDAGLVTVTKEGTRNIYAARREGVEVLRRYLDGLWSDVLTAFAEHVELKEQK
ncbi:ArsR/SmtB family transcription factor [Shimia abyssi]|nr:metalloregulator ArsR/SmtB family transcription factor [Shimia abyssi]